MPPLEQGSWTIEKQAWSRILGHLLDNYPKEACGILLTPCDKPRQITEAQSARNATVDDPVTRYLVDPVELLDVDEMAERKGLDICGFYHSHPDHPCSPSEYDRMTAWEGYLYLIVSIRGGKFDEAGAWIYDTDAGYFYKVILHPHA